MATPRNAAATPLRFQSHVRTAPPAGMVQGNDAIKNAREAGQAEMAKITEGLPLPPGMKLPFG